MIESINNTLKTQLDLERHGGRTMRHIASTATHPRPHCRNLAQRPTRPAHVAIANRIRPLTPWNYSSSGMLDAEKILDHRGDRQDRVPHRSRPGRGGTRGVGCRPAERPRSPGKTGGLPGSCPWRWTSSAGDFSGLPDDFTYVFHAAVDPGAADWNRCVETNAQMSGELLYHCRTAKGFVFCSTGSIYAYQGQRPLTESDPPGVPLRANYSMSKVAAEAVCTWIARRYSDSAHHHPDLFDVWSAGRGARRSSRCDVGEANPSGCIPDKPNNYNPIYEDDYVELGIRALEVATVAAGRGELGRQRDGQCRGLLHLHG